MTTEAENMFIDRIDCKFPYQDREECLRLIDEAATLSTNAMFSVIEEICRIPISEKQKVTTSFLLDLLKLSAKRLDHPLKEMVLDTAEKMVKGEELDVNEVKTKMGIIKKYPGQYAALSILYFSCDDKEEKLEPVWDNILTEWNK